MNPSPEGLHDPVFRRPTSIDELCGVFYNGPVRDFRLRRLAVSTALAILVGTLLVAALARGLFSTAQVQSTDFLFTRQSEAPSDAVVIVGIDQRSYRELLPRYGPLVNWSRRLYAQGVDRLREAGARVIGLDLFFDAPGQEDPALIASIQKAGNVVFPVEGQGPNRPHPRPGVVQAFDVLVRATPQVAQAAAAEGSVNVTTDRDTVVRSLPLLLQSGDSLVPSFSLAVVSTYVRRRPILDQAPAADAVYGAGRAVPVIDNGRMLINFSGPPSLPGEKGTFQIIPFVDVINGSFDARAVQDKIVLIGLTVRGIDEFATPTTTETGMWGVELQANAIETLLNDQYLTPLPRRWTVTLVYLGAIAGALLAATMGPLRGFIDVAGLLLVYVLASSLAFDRGILLNMIYPIAALLIGFAATQVYRIFFEQAQRELAQELMGRYLSPAVSRWVLEQPDQLRLGGDTRTMTVLFCDLRGFTTLSHSLEPQALVAFINEYMTAMTQVVFRHDGVLDKYIGDEIMAFWNAPKDQPDHASRACRAALDMVGELRRLRASWSQRNLPLLDIGIGINTGPMVVGNMGSRDRLAYTVIGDTVNVASRLQSLNKELGTRILMTEAARTAAGEGFPCRPLEQVKVRGRDERVTIFEIDAPLEPSAN